MSAQYARACANGSYMIAAGFAAQMKPLALGEALLFLPLLADNDPGKFEAAAVRWHARWLHEGHGVDLASSSLVLSALAAIRSGRREEALKLLRSLV